jgi:hypothetical protein
MKRIIFLTLALLMTGAASMNAQVRIGGLNDPNPSAVLDLNAANTADNGNLGLALPRVSLSGLKAKLNGNNTPPDGMLVYNTNATLGTGIYYWSGNSWVKILNSDTQKPSVTYNLVINSFENQGTAMNRIDVSSYPNVVTAWFIGAVKCQGQVVPFYTWLDDTTLTVIPVNPSGATINDGWQSGDYVVGTVYVLQY